MSDAKSQQQHSASEHGEGSDGNPPTGSLAEQPTILTPHASAGAGAPSGSLPLQPSTGSSSPRQLGQYELLEKIGQGGMGVVYRARHIKLDKLVAIKLLPSDFMRTEQSVARFEREMKAVGKISHPNIVQAHDAGEINGTHYLAMELVEGTDLTKLVKDHGPLSVAQACEVIQQTALGLDAAHKGGLVHRDIKPSNLLLAKSGQIKILDLGLARMADDSHPVSAELTSTGQVLGTPDYMAPEQWDDTHTADARTDLYAIGCTLFYLLVGRPPFGTDEFRSVMKKMAGHANAPIPELKSARPDVPDGVNAIYQRLMAKQPADRFASAAGLAAALQPFVSSNASVGVLSRSAEGDDSCRVRQYAGLPMVSSQSSHTLACAATVDFPGVPKHTNRRLLIVVGLLACVVLVGIVIQFSVRRWSPNTAGSADRTSPPNNEAATKAGDLRSNPSAGSGGPSTANGGWQGWPVDAPPPAIAPFNSEQAEQHQKAWAKFLGVKVEYTNSLGMKFRLIPPGEFLRGSTPKEIEEALKSVPDHKLWQEYVRSESPPHQVILTQPVYLGIHEVTQSDYQKVMGRNPSSFATTGPDQESVKKVAGLDTSRHPVETVSWIEAVEFCAKVSQQEKSLLIELRTDELVAPLARTGYRLSTEAEWEFACRAGTTTKYWIGDTDEDLYRAGWCGTNSNRRTHAVGELLANPFGLFDVHGNVFEWVLDGWEPAYYDRFQKTPALDPTGSTSSTWRLLRGGQWGEPTSDCRSSNRYAHGTGHRDFYTGFRVSLPVEAARESLKVTGPAMVKGVATTRSAPASDPIDYTAERKVAEALLKLNKGKTILANDKTSWELQQPLPDEPFYVSDVGFVEVDITDDEIGVLAGCRGLLKLDARANARLTAAGLKNVGALPRLETLMLDETACARESLEFLANYPRLSTLAISGDSRVGIMQTLPPCHALTSLTTPYRRGSVGDEGLQTIVRHCPKLTELSVNDSQKFSLVPLSQLRTLQKLHCWGSQLSEAGIGTLAELPNFHTLGVEVPDRTSMPRLAKLENQIREFLMRDQNGSGPESLTDAADWLPITRFAKLEQLTIMNLIAVDAASLQAVAAMPSLKSFSVHGDLLAGEREKLRRYTAEDVAAFRMARPDVQLNIDGQEFPATK